MDAEDAGAPEERPWALASYGWDPVSLTAQKLGTGHDDYGAQDKALDSCPEGASGGSFPVLVTRDISGTSKPARLVCQVRSWGNITAGGVGGVELGVHERLLLGDWGAAVLLTWAGQAGQAPSCQRHGSRPWGAHTQQHRMRPSHTSAAATTHGRRLVGREQQYPCMLPGVARRQQRTHHAISRPSTGP